MAAIWSQPQSVNNKPLWFSGLALRMGQAIVWMNDGFSHWGRDKIAAISQMTFSNAFSSIKNVRILIKISWKFVPKVWINNIPALVQTTSHYLNQWWLSYWHIYASLGLNGRNTDAYVHHIALMCKWLLHNMDQRAYNHNKIYIFWIVPYQLYILHEEVLQMLWLVIHIVMLCGMPCFHCGFRNWIAGLGTVYPKKYAHGFVVLCFVVVMQSFIMNSHEVFIHIHQGCFAGTGAIVRLPQCQWSKPDGYGKISQCLITTKHSKAKTVCIFLGIYC